MTARGFPDWVRGDVAAAGIAGRWLMPHEGETLPVEAGAYVLAVFLDHLMTVDLPGRGSQRLAPGWHLYLGSARGPGGLSARIRRHFRRDRPERTSPSISHGSSHGSPAKPPPKTTHGRECSQPDQHGRKT